MFAEIPQAIDKEAFESIFRQTNESRPFIFVGVRRGNFNRNSNSLFVSDWGDDVSRLVNRYRKYIESYPEITKTRKENELMIFNLELMLILIKELHFILVC